MTVVRRDGEQSAAGTGAMHGLLIASAIGLLGWLGLAASAHALIITGGPRYALPGGGSCAVTPGGVTTINPGATVTCTGVNLAAHTKVYFGIKNAEDTVNPGTDVNVNGNTMTGAQPSGAAIFGFSTNGASSITYTSTTTLTSATSFFTNPNPQTVTNRLVIALVSGSGTVVSTGGIPASNGNGAIERVFQLTGGSTYQFEIDLQASSEDWTLGHACTAVYDPGHATFGSFGDVSKVDLAFYFSDCGDGTIDSPEQCDDGGANGTLASCCTTTCQFKPMGTSCADDGNGCTNDICNGASAICTHPNNAAPCNDGVFCNGNDTCSGGGCVVHAGDPCLPLNITDANCAGSCNEAGDACNLADPNGTGCNDGLFCNGTDTCNGGSCTTHGGDPCQGPDGDTDCSETCDEGADNCLGADPDGTPCRGVADVCDVAETCLGGACPADDVQPSGNVCNAGTGDSCDPDEVCDGVGTGCPADTITPSGTVCRPGSGDTCDPDETCSGVADDPCPADVVEPTTTVCRTGSGDLCDPDEVCPGVPTGTCAADVVAPNGTVCDPGSGDACDPDEICSGTAGDPCPGDFVQPTSFVCRPAAGSCDAPDNCPGVPAGTCAADAKEPSGTPCRPASGVCDIAEACDGSSNSCPADQLEPDGTSCSDGLFCNGAETCQSGSCADGTDPCTFVCSEGTDMCLTNACPAAPQANCRTSTKKLLMVKNKVDDNKDKLIWKFIKGEETTQAEFGDPTATAAYALCIYAGAMDDLVATLSVPPVANWAAIGDKGYKYKDKTSMQSGVSKLIVKGGGPGKSKALLKGKGVNLPTMIDSTPLGTDVTAQLLNHESGICWEATFTAPKKDTTSLYKATQ